MNTFSVYMHVVPDGRRYIGITSKEPKKRWCGGSGYFYNTEFHKAIKQYGWNNIEHKILFTGLSKEEAEKKEIELIAKYHTTDPEKGFNYTNGGNHRGMTSEATKAILRSKARKSACICVETGILYESINEAAAAINIHPSSVSNSCSSGGLSSSKGFHFIYADVKKRPKPNRVERWW